MKIPVGESLCTNKGALLARLLTLPGQVNAFRADTHAIQRKVTSSPSITLVKKKEMIESGDQRHERSQFIGVLAFVNIMNIITVVLVTTVTIYSVFQTCQGLVDPKHDREVHP